MKTRRPFILNKAYNPFVFSVARNTSNLELNQFFGDLGNLVRTVDKEVNKSVEKISFYEGARASIVGGMKSSFYVCAYEFKDGDLIREHKIYFPGLISGTLKIFLEFDATSFCGGCFADDKVRQMAIDLDYVDLQLFGGSHIPIKQGNDNW